ncbi:hypothetical protein BRADI_1g13475v3 [Brachypodium distachyon]|uniref:Uncharacterized protein n=1 Tax=Brachypodium distachyon TaxID=15368 RepID=A0A0Q3NAY6_BRADI|nr:hypothetical protein BRADI_1g13475v3 [Brachypodium distachyon]
MNIARRDGNHLFFKCKHVKSHWRAIQQEDLQCKLAACGSAMEMLSPEQFQFAVRHQAQEWKCLSHLQEEKKPSAVQAWNRPPAEFVKINCHGAFQASPSDPEFLLWWE